MTPQQFADAYKQGMKRTMAFLLSRGVPGDAVADVTQTAWMRGWQHLGQLREEGMIVPWINTIALNQYRRGLRNRVREEAWMADHSEPPTALLNWAAIDVSRILDACRPADRDLL